MNRKVFCFALIISLVFGSSPEGNDNERKMKKKTFKSTKSIKTVSLASSGQPLLVRKVKTRESPVTTSPSIESVEPSKRQSNSLVIEPKPESEDFAFGLINFGSSVDALENIEDDNRVQESKATDQLASEQPATGTANNQNDSIGYFETLTQKLASSGPEKVGYFENPWDTDFEGEWCLSPVEIKQLFTASCFGQFADYIDAPFEAKDAVFGDCLVVDRNWPELATAPLPSSLSIRFQMLAVLAIVIDCSDTYLRKLFAGRLFDSERPVFDKSTDTYKSFLALAIDRENPNLKKIELILEYIPKHMVNKPDSKGVTPLEIAIIKNDLVLVKKLVEAGADMNISMDSSKYTPFMLAIICKNTAIAEYLMDTGKVDYAMLLSEGDSVLSLAAYHFPSDLIQKVLYATAESPNFHPTPFARILAHNFINSKPIFEVLIKEIYKSDKNVKLFPIPALLARNILMKNKLSAIRYLKSLNIPMNILLPCDNFHKCRLIHMAAMLGQLEMFKLFLSFGISPLELTEYKMSVLQVAYISNQFRIVEEILKGGVYSGLEECLEHAFGTDNFDMIRVLLKSSIDLDNFYFSSGRNLITKAVAMNKPGILQILLESGKFNPYQPDALGQSIIDMALPVNSSEILKVFVNREIQFANQIFKDLLKEIG